jgi:hypothetical protein
MKKPLQMLILFISITQTITPGFASTLAVGGTNPPPKKGITSQASVYLHTFLHLLGID